jgi:large subunit ribosomal protein L31
VTLTHGTFTEVLRLPDLRGTPRETSRRGRTERLARRSPLAHCSKLLGVKASIHPDYQLANVHCSCGNQFYTRSTKDDLHVELCSECHPFYTGKQKLVDTGGRVERFQRRQAKHRAGRR